MCIRSQGLAIAKHLLKTPGQLKHMTEVNQIEYSKGGTTMGADASAKRKKWVRLAVIVLLALLLLGLSIFSIRLLLSPEGDEKAGVKRALREDQEAFFIKEPFYLELGDFVVNLAGGRRYLKTNLQLLLNEPSALEYLAIRMAEVRDLIVSELQSLSAEQLRDPKERELLKQRILRRIESLLPPQNRPWRDPRPLKKVLITEFYLQ